MEGENDYISDLPDTILHQILSLIPTKLVVSSSCVSKRWGEISAGYLRYARTFQFDEEFAKQQTPDQLTENINRILSLNKSEEIRKFKLVFSLKIEHMFDVTDWILFATGKDVEELDLDFLFPAHFLSPVDAVDLEDVFVLPNFLFDCKTLETVKLSRCILGLPEEYTGFRGIQTLCLSQVHVTDSMLGSLLSNCTLLEVLVLKECGALTSIRIRSHTHTRLQRLTVYECNNASFIEISGPKITSLLISASNLKDCKLEDLFVLEEVLVGTRGYELYDAYDALKYVKLFGQLKHVRTMYINLSHSVPSWIKMFKVPFKNLRELHLVNSPLFGLFESGVCSFLWFPSLQKLTIELPTVSEEENFSWVFTDPDSTSNEREFKSLRTVTFRNFRGTNADFELATHVLERAPSLESILLIAPQNLNAQKITPKDEVSFWTLKIKETEVWLWQKAVFEKFRYFSKVSEIVDVQVCEGDEHDTSLLSFFDLHYVSDVYNNN